MWGYMDMPGAVEVPDSMREGLVPGMSMTANFIITCMNLMREHGVDEDTAEEMVLRSIHMEGGLSMVQRVQRDLLALMN